MMQMTTMMMTMMMNVWQKWMDVLSRKSRKPPSCELCHYQFRRHKHLKVNAAACQPDTLVLLLLLLHGVSKNVHPFFLKSYSVKVLDFWYVYTALSWNVFGRTLNPTLPTCHAIWHVKNCKGYKCANQILWPHYLEKSVLKKESCFNFGTRIFRVAAPTIWNSLPADIRACSLITIQFVYAPFKNFLF